MGAKKRAKAPTIDSLTVEQRAAVYPQIARALEAAMAQSEAEVAYTRWIKRPGISFGNYGVALGDARNETNEAGTALAKALRGLVAK